MSAYFSKAFKTIGKVLSQLETKVKFHLQLKSVKPNYQQQKKKKGFI